MWLATGWLSRNDGTHENDANNEDLRNAPSKAIQNPEPRNSSKKTEKFLPAPEPGCKFLERNRKYGKSPEVHPSSIFGAFAVCFEFFFKEFGARRWGRNFRFSSGVWGQALGKKFSVLFEQFQGSGFRIPVAGRAFLKRRQLREPQTRGLSAG